MEYYNNILCATYDDLLEVMSVGTIKSLIARDKIKNIGERGGNGRKARYAYHSLPELYRLRYEAKFGDPDKSVIKQLVKDEIRISPEATRYYREVCKFDDKLVKEYAINATALAELLEIYNDRSALRNASGNNRRDIWDAMILSSEQIRSKYKHTLPTTPSRLRDKIARYKTEGLDSLISGKVGNSNTTKITEEAGRYLIALKRSSVPIYNDTQIFDKFNTEALSNGYKPLSSKSSLRMYFNRPEIMPLWWDAVHGELASSQRFGRKNKTDLPTVRDSLWYGDGTKLNLYYKYYEESGKLRVATTSVYEVMDAYSEVLLGYWISDHEDHEAQCHAYRMALQTSGCKPYEIVHDNQGGHKKIKEFMGRLVSGLSRPTAPYRGQSKTIESAFGRFQTALLHGDWRFTGLNITTKKANSRPNLERIEANKEQLFTLAELKQHYSAARKIWNTMSHPATGISRLEMYQKSANPDTVAIAEYEMIDLFWLKTSKAVTYTDNGIEVQIKGKKYAYEVYDETGMPDHAFLRKNMWRKFYIEYDLYDMSTVRLYAKTASGSKFAAIAKTYMRVQRNIQEQKEGDMSFIRREQMANIEDRIQRQVEARIIELEHGMSMEQQGLKRPTLKGMSKAHQEEIERRVAQYSKDPEAIITGVFTKKISLMTFDQLNGEITFDERRAASKY